MIREMVERKEYVPLAFLLGFAFGILFTLTLIVIPLMAAKLVAETP